MLLLKPALDVTISLIFEFNNPKPVVINSGSYLLLLLSVGSSGGVGGLVEKKVGSAIVETATTCWSVSPVNLDSPKSCNAIMFLKLLLVVLTRFCLLVTQTSILVICTLLLING